MGGNHFFIEIAGTMSPSVRKKNVGGNKTTSRATTRHTIQNGEELRHPKSSNHTTESVKECNDNDTNV